MLVVGMNHRRAAGATESTVFGPFFIEGSPAFEHGDDLANGAPGTPCFISGTVRSTDGEAIPGALLDIWQADEDGFYDVQKDLDAPQNRAHLTTDADGNYRFWAVKPVAYPIPDDGPVGELLRAGGRGPMRPAHIHFMVTAPGYARLITHVFAAGDEYLDTDAVFGVKQSLIADFIEHTDEGKTYYAVQYDLVLATTEETQQ